MAETVEIGQKILIFVLFLAPLIFFHELGHFLFARFCGVRVETFSIGFGPKILKWTRGATTYAVSLIPFGGYVKMFGDDPLREEKLSEEEKKVAFNHKTKWQRFLIVFGGPLANFIMAYVLYYFLVLGGEIVPQIQFSQVPEDSQYYAQGLRSGDSLFKLNENRIVGAYELNLADDFIERMVVKTPSDELKTVSVGKKLTQFIQDLQSFSVPQRRPLMTSKEGKIFALSLGQTINWELSLSSIAEKVNAKAANTVVVTELLSPLKDTDFNSPNLGAKQELEVLASESKRDFWQELLDKHGLVPVDLRVSKIVEGSVAEKIGLQANDAIVAVGGQHFFSFDGFSKALQQKAGAAANNTIELTYWREGEEIIETITPSRVGEGDSERFLLGVYGSIVPIPPKMVETQGKDVFSSFGAATTRTWQAFAGTLSMIAKLLSFDYPLENLGGVLIIGKVANDSLDVSISYFLKLMAIMSINLGLLNLLPIPVLDGGHIVFLGVEALKGGPLSRKKMEILQTVGLSLLLTLMALALYNDITRLF